jgi:hypothetical protein
MNTTAQRIAAEHNLQAGQIASFANTQAAMTDARELAIKTTAADCVRRTFHFHDGSKLVCEPGEVRAA